MVHRDVNDLARDNPLSGRPITRRRLLQGIGLQFTIRIFGVATGIAVAAGLARGLSHSDFGTFSLLLSLSAMATTLLDLGISSTAVRQVSINPPQSSTIAGALIAIRLLGGIVGAAFVIAIASVVVPDRGRILAAVLVGGSLLLGPLGALQPIAQAQLRIGATNLLMLLQSLLWTGVVLALAAVRAPLIAFAAGFFAVAFIQSVSNWFTYKTRVRVEYTGVLRQTRALFAIAWPVALGGLFVTAYYRLDGVILFHYHGSVTNAYFAAAYRFLDVLQVIPATLLSVVMPLLAATWGRSRQESGGRRQRLFSLSLSALITASLPVSVGGALIAASLIRTVYGPGFSNAAGLLAILLLALPAISVGYIAVGLALACGRTRLYAYAAAGGAAINIALNFWLIPPLGAPVAAWTTVGTEYGVATVLLIALTRNADVRPPWRSLGKAAIATGCLALAVTPVRHWPVAWSIVIGAVVFTLVAAALRLVTVAEVRSLTSRESLERA